MSLKSVPERVETRTEAEIDGVLAMSFGATEINGTLSDSTYGHLAIGYI